MERNWLCNALIPCQTLLFHQCRYHVRKIRNSGQRNNLPGLPPLMTRFTMLHDAGWCRINSEFRHVFLLADLTGHKGIIPLIILNRVRKYNFTDWEILPDLPCDTTRCNRTFLDFLRVILHMEEKVERKFVTLESKIDNLEKRVRELEDITSPKIKPDLLSYLRDKYANGDL